MPTKLILESAFLRETLPSLSTSSQRSYRKLVATFKALIKAKDENSAFFRRPVKYLKANGALPFDEVEVPGEGIIPIIDDKTLASTIRKARKLYQAGNITLDNVMSSFCYETKSTAWYAARSESTETTRDTFLREHASATDAASTSTNERCMCFESGRNILEIDGLPIGPLVNPSVFNRVKGAISQIKKMVR